MIAEAAPTKMQMSELPFRPLAGQTFTSSLETLPQLLALIACFYESSTCKFIAVF
jgi:hypothetical protein